MGTEPDSKRKGVKKQRVCSVGQESITVLLYLLLFKNRQSDKFNQMASKDD
jgi:hypothetical protein